MLSPFFGQDGPPSLRPRPLFNVGIHDIPFLSSNSDASSSWIACTTDGVLATKTDLFDILVTLPPTAQSLQKAFPKISIVNRLDKQHKQGKLTPLKATQRDARRFVILRDGLRRLPSAESPTDQDSDDDIDAASTFSSSSIIEPLSWPRLAYTSFLWWASAGEKRSGLSEEEEEQDEQDTSLLASSHHQGQLSHPGLQSHESDQPREIALIAYFRRLTTLIFTTLADAVARQDDVGETDEFPRTSDEYRDDPDEQVEPSSIGGAAFSDERDDDPLLPSSTDRDDDKQQEPAAVSITSSDISEMGLDIWSTTDRIFMEELLYVWWGRKANVDGTRIRCCGIPII
jgi:Domain of unknown function (DUF4484)/DENN domain-containing protein 11